MSRGGFYGLSLVWALVVGVALRWGWTDLLWMAVMMWLTTLVEAAVWGKRDP